MATTTKAMHTPGPWVLDMERDEFGVTMRVYMADAIDSPYAHDSAHALVVYEGADDDAYPDQFAEMSANARLIAAAPEMLDALKAHDAYMGAQFMDGPDSAALHPKAAENWLRVRAAIAKAEGRS